MTQLNSTHTPLPAPTWQEWLLWLLRQRSRIQVTGDSMQPTLNSGDIVLINHKAYIKSPPEVGHIVLARHPYQKNLLIIKRVADINTDGRLILHSDNKKAGSDSRQFGTISPERILGQVTACSKSIK